MSKSFICKDYAVIKRVAIDAFGTTDNFFMYDEYIRRRDDVDGCIVALGMNSGKEVKVGRSLSMDWVLAQIVDGAIVGYVGVEVQSIDITGNYRDAGMDIRILKQTQKRQYLHRSMV
jgi:hypothetical protein